MCVATLIPWRGGCLHRARALSHVLSRHPANGWPVVVGRGRTAGPWVKAHAVDTALQRTDAQIIVVADADVWTDGIPAAVDAVRDGAPWAIPHGDVHRLTELGGPEQPPYQGIEGGGIVVLRRDVLLDISPDPLFVGWGQEDQSWGLALRTVYGAPWRGDAPLTHFFHPPQPRMTRRRGSFEGWARFKRYLRAQDDPAAMRALTREGRDDAHCSAEPADPDHQAHDGGHP